jgi:hypothetical protein
MSMKRTFAFGIALLGAGLACAVAQAQEPAGPPPQDSSQPAYNPGPAPQQMAVLSPVPLEWTPPALERLSAQAAVKSSFTLDRNLLNAAAALLPDSQAEDRVVLRKLDGVSVHTMRFSEAGIPDEREVASIREAYHLRGWKHVVSSAGNGGPVHSDTTDVWVVMDGVSVRGAVILAETPRSLTLVTVAGNLNPVDILHLRGHFGIPRFEGEPLRESHNQ